MKIPGPPRFWQELPPDQKHRCMELRQSALARLAEADLAPFRSLLEQLPKTETAEALLDQAVIELGSASGPQRQKVLEALQAFIPWKKGPFNICGYHIDAEWRSDLKWERLQPHLPPLKGARICDIGCNNGYFMLRMAAHEPEFVMGLEPVAKHWFAFQLLQHWARLDHIHFELLGVEHMELFEQSFDVVFCLGILYHHTDPVGILRAIRKSLRKKGQLIVDCQGIKGQEPVALVPGPRYAGARGVWFLPTLPALIQWLRRAGFQETEVLYEGKLGCEEQRTTAWAPIRSLGDFLDPENDEKTCEGYSAPYRFYVRARL